MRLFDFVYLTERAAIEIGCTHEGSIFGVPAWLYFPEPGNRDLVAAAPKVPVLQLVTVLCDMLLNLALFVLPADVYLEAPVEIGRRIHVGPPT